MGIEADNPGNGRGWYRYRVPVSGIASFFGYRWPVSGIQYPKLEVSGIQYPKLEVSGIGIAAE